MVSSWLNYVSINSGPSTRCKTSADAYNDHVCYIGNKLFPRWCLIAMKICSFLSHPLVLKIVSLLCFAGQYKHRAYSTFAFHRFLLRHLTRVNLMHNVPKLLQISLIKSLLHLGTLVTLFFLVSPVIPGFLEPHPHWISEGVRKRTNIKRGWRIWRLKWIVSGTLHQNGYQIYIKIRGWNHTAGVRSSMA